MAAAPQLATMTLATGGGNLTIDVYLNDVVANLGNFDSGSGAAAGTETFYKAPCNASIIDFSILTGMTDTTLARITIDGSNTRTTVRYANHLNTLNSRPALNVPVGKGENIGLMQLA